MKRRLASVPTSPRPADAKRWDAEEAWDLLGQAHSEIFENELCGWHTEPPAWPQGRTFEMFQEWFHVEFHSVVEDLCNCEIVDEDDADAA